jgi:hypothetical protein
LLVIKSELYTDKGYTDFLSEDNLAQLSSINLMTIRKKNSTRPDSLCLAYIKQVKASNENQRSELLIEGDRVIVKEYQQIVGAATMEGAIERLLGDAIAIRLS